MQARPLAWVADRPEPALPLTCLPVCDLFAIVGHPVSCATRSCQASMQIQLLLSELETITHFLSPGKDFVKCELAG